jgi:predicted phage baseplate assembly protein
MPIPVPNLDDRSYDDLVREALARIPAHTPEWTNPAPGDPGRTLVELFAWLTDTLLYRVNLIPEKQRLAFLNLLGERMRPAAAARTVIALAADPPRAAVEVPALSPLGGNVVFETRGTVTVLPVLGECYAKVRLSPGEAKAMAAKLPKLREFYGATGPIVPYLTTAVFPAGRVPEPFDLAERTIDGCLWLALLRPKDLSQTAALAALAPSDTGPRILNIGLVPALETPDFGNESLARSPIEVAWEISTRDTASGRVAWRELVVEENTTNGLRTDGIVRLVLPEPDALFAPPNNVRAARNAGTGGDNPPRVDDPETSARLLGWLRLRPAQRTAAPRLAWAGVNAVAVDALRTSRLLVVGQGTGQPELRVQLPPASGPGGERQGLDAGSFELEVVESGLGSVPWKRVDDLHLGKPHERVYTLDAEAGVVTFGDGARGRIPEAGARIRVKLMRQGGGTAGNVPAGTLTGMTFGLTRFKVQQPLAATGGDNGETLDVALSRIPQAFRTRDRAVTAEDYRALATATPGVRVGRVEVLPGFKPQTRDFDVPGVVSVMALPDRAGFEPPYPRVDRPFIEAVTNYLDARRPLGTEMVVIGCEYVPLALTVGVNHPPGEGPRVLAAVQSALKKFLFALRPGGPAGDGWPLGGTVRRRELEIVVSRVAGVTGVSGPYLFTKRDGTWFEVTTGSPDIELTLQRWQLPELLGVMVTAGEAPRTFTPPPPAHAEDGFAIPVVPEVC